MKQFIIADNQRFYNLGLVKTPALNDYWFNGEDVISTRKGNWVFLKKSSKAAFKLLGYSWNVSELKSDLDRFIKKTNENEKILAKARVLLENAIENFNYCYYVSSMDGTEASNYRTERAALEAVNMNGENKIVGVEIVIRVPLNVASAEINLTPL